MSHSSPPPPPPSPRWRRFAYIGLAMGVVSLAGATAVTWWVRSHLAPLCPRQLARSFSARLTLAMWIGFL
ncbi:MAG: hypothetical protein HC925_01785 [Coleofasciculaceae cyanobacterium SM2_3_26]|nr:hypothetical protein [Coleofasciculaceae cyanobacterium SM2_3_26]